MAGKKVKDYAAEVGVTPLELGKILVTMKVEGVRGPMSSLDEATWEKVKPEVREKAEPVKKKASAKKPAAKKTAKKEDEGDKSDAEAPKMKIVRKKLADEFAARIARYAAARCGKRKVVARDKKHLQKLISEAIREDSRHANLHADLNFIDVSKVTDMSDLFRCSKFNGDISRWDVQNVTNMRNMFSNSKFRGARNGISNWNVSCVTDMSSMFSNSRFDGDISGWNVQNVTNMKSMFSNSSFSGAGDGISNWNVSRVTDMSYMFSGSGFKGTIFGWNVSSVVGGNLPDYRPFFNAAPWGSYGEIPPYPYFR